MLIKEYRIPLPMTVEEYRIAQLYMIAKKSREESKGTESGVEILVNEPYTDGPGGSGQFTHKIYHVGSHLPGWFKSLLPRSALTVEEEAWNAYPYTKTRFKCPFVEKFSLEIETYYTPDGGHQENVFNLSDSEKRNRVVDLIDVVKDIQDDFEDPEREDPTVYVSQKTGRGPLEEDWINQYWSACKGKTMPTQEGKAIMCAYKLCKVEFRYWGMQSKIERFIHDTALRKTMLKAHNQAWVWQDEWFGLTMEDIRAIERETADLLRRTMHGAGDGSEEPDAEDPETADTTGASLGQHFNSIEYSDRDVPNILPRGTDQVPRRSVSELAPPTSNSRLDTISRKSDDDSEDEFYDCRENLDETASLAKWSSMELTPIEGDDIGPKDQVQMRRVQSLREPWRESSAPPTSQHPAHYSLPVGSGLNRPIIDIADTDGVCSTTVLILVVHGGSVLDPGSETSVRKSDVTTFRGAFESIMRTHYPSLVGHIMIKCVPCPAVCTEALTLLSSLSPYSFDVNPGSNEDFGISNDQLPVGTIPIMAAQSPEYEDNVGKVVQTANKVYRDFLQSEDGIGFCGQVVLVGDSMGAILAYDALCRGVKRTSSDGSVAEHESAPPSPRQSQQEDESAQGGRVLLLSAPPCTSVASSVSSSGGRRRFDSAETARFEFDVCDFFSFGSPLGLLLAFRKVQVQDRSAIPRPPVHQMYNLFHPADPIGCRVEPLLSARFSRVPPINVPRYQKYPMGDGTCYSLIEFVQSNPSLFCDNSRPNTPGRVRRHSDESILSGVIDTQQLHTINALKSKWWGARRVDFALYCPEGLANFPVNSLPHLFHSSYWESADVISFMLRQLVRGDGSGASCLAGATTNEVGGFTPNQAREKWIKKRTSVKIRNGAANHRANDVIVKEGRPQILQARFAYGPLDMADLTGERVDIHVMKEPPAGDWIYVATETTDKNGRITYQLPPEHTLSYGIYPVRMLVRGDHTMMHMYIAVVPPRTETVVFSIDGSFAASFSFTGKDPKVKPGAVDIVRHWQELGYIITYVTARPDMQLQRVVSWLSQHNFPHGLVSFADGFTTDPLRHKAEYLKNLMDQHDVIIHCAYGSSKDIGVYSSLGLKPDQIYVVGKVSKKQQVQSTWLPNGYADHLAKLTAPGGSRPAEGNARMVIAKTNFALPGQKPGLQRRRTVRAAKRTTSFPFNATVPQQSHEGNNGMVVLEDLHRQNSWC